MGSVRWGERENTRRRAECEAGRWRSRDPKGIAAAKLTASAPRGFPMSAPSAPPEPLHILVIDDEKHQAEDIAESLERRGHACTVATSGKAGAAKLDEDSFDVVLTDLKMADLGGLAVVEKCKRVQPDAEVYVITGHADVKTAVEAMKLGASHYLQKPIDLGELLAVVENSAKRVRTVRDL